MFRRVWLTIAALAAASPANAAIQYYYTGAAVNTEAIFDSLSGVVTDFNFAGEALPASVLLDAGPTGLDFRGYSNNAASPTPVALNLTGTRLELSVSFSGSNGANLRIEIPTDVRVLSLHLTATGGATSFCFEAAGTSNCDLAGGGSLIMSTGNTYFFGIRSDEAIPVIQIRNATSGSRLQIMDFGVQLASAETPEPSTMALMGGALILFPLMARRRPRR